MAYKSKRGLNYILESVGVIAIILLINQIWFSHNYGYLGVSPNPYWLVVIFVALRYGAFPGLIAGIISSAALLVSTSFNAQLAGEMPWPHIPYDQWKLAALFLIFGFLMGQERTRVDKIVEALKTKYNKLRGEFENLAMDNLGLKKINTELEGRILGQTDTVNTIYEVARKLTDVEGEEMYPAIVSLVKRIVGAERCSLYLWEGDDYMLRGFEGKAPEASELDLAPDIIQMALQQKRVITVKDVIGAEGSQWREGKDPPMVAPLIFGKAKDTVSGLIIVEEIAFTRLNPDSISFLSLMADWVSRAMDTKYSAMHATLDDIYDPGLGLFRYDYALKKIQEEVLSVKVKDTSTAIIMVTVRGFESIPQEEGRDIIRRVAEGLKHALRAADTLSSTDEPGSIMAILPGADDEGAKEIAERFSEKAETLGVTTRTDSGDIPGIDMATVIVDAKMNYENELDVVRDAKTAITE